MHHPSATALLRRPDAGTVDGTTPMADVRRWIALRNEEQHRGSQSISSRSGLRQLRRDPDWSASRQPSG